MSRRLRGAAALLLVGLLAAPAAADTSPSPTPEPEDPIRVVVTQILPRAPGPGDAVEVTGILRNTGSRAVTDLRVRLQVGDRIGTRSQLHQADTDRPPTGFRMSATPARATLQPGATTTFDLRTSVQALGLSGIGVYPLDVVARGNAGDGIDSLGLSPTWLPYFAYPPRPTRVAVVWPLVDRPHLRPDGTLDDDELSTTLAASGRLGRMLAVALGAQVRQCEPAPKPASGKAAPAPKRCEPVLVTYAVDPELLDTAQTMTRPYQVGKVHGTGSAVALRWLTELQAGGLADRLLALPYADPDVTALAREARWRDDIANATALGSQVASSVLGTTPLSTVAWPPAGPVTPAAADALALGGPHAFVLDPSAYDDPGVVPNPTPGAASVFTTTATGAALTGLVVDPDLSALLAAGSPYGSRVAEQRFLAETAMIAAQEPGVSRTFVIAPPRRGVVPPAATDELRDLGRVPWLCPVLLASVAVSAEHCPGESPATAPGPVLRSDIRTDATGSLTPSYLAGVIRDRDVATQLTDNVLTGNPAARDQVASLKSELRRAVARAESSAGRDSDEVARNNAALLHSTISALVAQVVVRGGRSLLTSTKGTLSVSLENTSTVPVQVRVRFTSKTATLTNAETGLVTVQPGHAVQAVVRARAQRSGQFVVFAQIIDRSGRPFGPEAEIIVRSTRFGRVALASTLVALGVLLVAAGIRIVRRARAARQ